MKPLCENFNFYAVFPLQTDEPDASPSTRRKKKLKGKSDRPSSGYLLPEVSSTPIQLLDHEDARLRGAVYFGYGLMNVILSLIPPKLMKLANLFGFHGDRRVGLEALEFASNSQDIKAPLARSATHAFLVWMHGVSVYFRLDMFSSGL